MSINVARMTNEVGSGPRFSCAHFRPCETAPHVVSRRFGIVQRPHASTGRSEVPPGPTASNSGPWRKFRGRQPFRLEPFDGSGRSRRTVRPERTVGPFLLFPKRTSQPRQLQPAAIRSGARLIRMSVLLTMTLFGTMTSCSFSSRSTVNPSERSSTLADITPIGELSSIVSPIRKGL